jgi:hypothetical protein
MGDLAAPKADRELDFVAFLKELDRVLQLEFEVVIVGAGPEEYTFNVASTLLLGRFAVALSGFVLVFAVVHDPANRGDGLRGHLDEVQPVLARHFKRFADVYDAELLAFCSNQAHVPYALMVRTVPKNLLVDAKVSVNP